MADPKSDSTPPGASKLEQEGIALQRLVKAGVVKTGNGLYLEVRVGQSPQWGMVYPSIDPKMIFLKENPKSNILRGVFLEDVISFILFEAVAFSSKDAAALLGAT